MKILLALVMILLSIAGNALGEDTKSALTIADSNKDGYLDKAELSNYFLQNDKKIVELRAQGMSDAKLRIFSNDLVDDCLSMGDTKVEKVTVDDALFYVERRAILTAKQKETKIGWTGLGFSRSLTDEADPRMREIDDLPFVLTYSHDNKREGKKDLFGALGTVTLVDIKKDWNMGVFQVKPGVDLDVDSSKDSTDSSIDFGISLSQYFFHKSDLISSHVISLTPKYGTDREFKRDVYEATLTWSFASPIIRSGYNTWIGGVQKTPDDAWIRVYWRPEIGLEFGKVGDAAGNQDLQKIKDGGTYTRLAAGGKITIAPLIISPKLSTSLSYKNRFDLAEGWNKDYWTAEVDYDMAKNVKFTVLYRNGAKPSSFTKIDTVLVGIGFTQ